ncbi:MAG: hypothetical protein KGH75_03155 [Rhodospirillales bacterium]|nr:hypothetical protein [Rhodospirillales bacterium]
MTQLIFLSVPPKSKVPVKASLFKCPTSHAQVVANEIMIPNSPFSGKPMQRITSKRIEVEASDIGPGDMRVVGTCKNCSHTLLASALAVAALKGKPHCVMCGSHVEPQLIKQALPVGEGDELEYGSDLHDDPEILHGDPKYADIGLNRDLIHDDFDADEAHLFPDIDAQEEMEDFPDMDVLHNEDDNDDNDQVVAHRILSEMDDEEDDDMNDGDEGDSDGDDDNDDDYYDDPDDTDEEPDEDDVGNNDYYDEDEDNPDEDEVDEAHVNHDDDDDDSMDATASLDWDSEDDDDEMGLEQPHTVGNVAVTTMDPDLITQDTSLRQVGISAADALHSTVTADNATLAVLPIDAKSAMILAMVEGVGYMPYVGLEEVKASEACKPLFANPTKLINAVNAVLANTQGDVIKDLAGFGVRQLNYNVKASSLIEKRIKEGVEAATSALNDEKEHLVEDLRQCLAIAATEVLKNLTDGYTNPVSASLADGLKQVGVRSANKLIDDAFTDKGPELMKTIIARGLELMDKPYDTRNEIAKYVTAAAGRNVLATASVGDRVADSLARGVVPLSAQPSAESNVETAVTANAIPVDASTTYDYKSIVKSLSASRRNSR